MLERMDPWEPATSRYPARDYDELDQREAQQQFVDDLLAGAPVAGDILDLGTGTAWIPVLVCQQVESCRIMAADLSVEMLDQARYTIEIHGVIDRVQLDHSDARKMLYKDGMFDLVISHRVLHETADPLTVLQEALRVTNAGGRLFFRDFLRPDNEDALEHMVETFADPELERQQQWYRQSLQAAWRLNEIQAMIEQLGFDAATIQAADEGFWTWDARKSDCQA